MTPTAAERIATLRNTLTPERLKDLRDVLELDLMMAARNIDEDVIQRLSALAIVLIDRLREAEAALEKWQAAEDSRSSGKMGV